MIITTEMVKQACSFAEPTILAILDDPKQKCVWGPAYVEVMISIPHNEKVIRAAFGASPEKKEWKKEWKTPKEFKNVAQKKLNAVLREGGMTSDLVNVAPWLFEKGEYLYPGALMRYGIAIAVSGARGRADEAIAEIILSMITMLAYLETDQRKKRELFQI